MSRTDRKNLLRSRFAITHGAILAARFLSPSVSHAEHVSLAPIPSRSETLTGEQRATLARDVEAARIAQDSRNWIAGKSRGMWLVIA